MQVSQLASHLESQGRRLHVKRILGKGAFAVVFEVADQENGEKYALKVAEKKDLSRLARKRLKTEVEIQCKLKAPGICPLVQFWEDESRGYLLLERSSFKTGGGSTNLNRASTLSSW